MNSISSVGRLQISTKFARNVRRPRQPRPSRTKICAYQITFIASDGNKVTAEAEESDLLLDVAEENNVDIPASCRGGMCGTCVSKLISGEVDMSAAMDLEECLTPEQIAEGYILCCSATPQSDCEIEWKEDWGVSTLEEWK
ncbi:hypothetical protein BSKO_11431 [Bryopsis sp. KO-2023]|nr:hypothetical protein BSKO_11431 [Bryopsis sp. KO-2023]